MKNIRLLVALTCYMLSFLFAEARRVDVEKAEKIARSYAADSKSRLSSRRDFRLSKTVSKRIARTRTEQSVTSQQQQQPQQQDEPLFFVFTANEDKGFIIISGDDIAKPVLGYSVDGTYDENNSNLAYWIETLSQEIAFAIENNLPQDEQIKAEWDALERNELPVTASGDYVDPLVKTKWNQSGPYNNLCPEISGTRTVSGCVATAMAQIMKHHEYPITRTVEIPGYTTGTKIKISSITGSTTYKWDKMSNTYSPSNTSEENEAVATLMYHCGVSVRMNYDLASNGGSGAYDSDVLKALKTYFGYDAGINYHYREYYSYTEWINLLKTEIKAGRPVYYSGRTNSSGHAFVCDGYDINDLFHINWGWGGSSDGYFEISALNPRSAGIGGDSDGYNQSQAIITGIQPDKGSQPPAIQLGLSTFEANKTSLSSLTESFNLTAGVLKNTGTVTVTNVYLGVLLYKEDGSYYAHKTARQTLSLSPGYSSSKTLLSNYSLPSYLPVGTYKLYPAFSPSDEIPHIIPGTDKNKYITVVVENDGSVTLSGGVETPKLSLVSLKAVGNLYQNKTGFFEAEITNSETADYDAELSLKIGSQTINNSVVIPSKTTKTIRFSSTITLSPGNCSLSILYDPDNTGTPYVQLGDAVSAEVKATPAAPNLSNLSLASAPSFPNGSDAVPLNAPNLTVRIENTGGLYQGNVSVYIKQYNSTSYYIGSFGNVFVSIDEGETKDIQYNNPLDLTPGQQYDAYIYISELGYLYPKFSFTLTEPVYSSDATLKNLVVKDANTQIPLTLSPDFSSTTENYTTVTGEGTTRISIIGEANHHRARFTNIENRALSTGENTFDLEVTAEDGTTKITYKIKVIAARIPSNDATLSSLTVSAGELTPPFDANTTNYTVNVSNDITSITVTGIRNHDSATVIGNVTDKPLDVGDNAMSITVTAEDGTTKTYTVTIRRLSNDATLKRLTVSEGTLSFDANTTDYTITVSNEITDVDVIGTANHDLATVSGNVKGKPLDVGDNAVSITVTAEDGITTLTYTVTVIRSDHVFETEANLIAVSINDFHITVDDNSIEYAADCDETSLSLDLQTSPYSTVTLNGAVYTAGQSINFAGGDTIVNIRVTAETGRAKTDYTLKITAPIDESKLYYQRWSDVIAINLNPATNGGYNVSAIRWYNPDGTVINGGYIQIQEGRNTSDYQAEIRVGNEVEWRRVCNVSETRSIEKIIAYPNPVPRGESVQLQLPEAFVGSVLNIYDMKGTLIKSGIPLPATSVSVNVSDLDSGIYLLRITGKDGDRQVIKVIIGS